MERLQAYKFELRPDGGQRRLMRRFTGSCRYVYNRALALQKERCERVLWRHFVRSRDVGPGTLQSESV